MKGGRGLVRAEVNEDPFGWVCLQKHTSFKPYDITAKPPDWLTEKGEEMPEIDTMAHFVLMSPRDIGAASRSRCLDPAGRRSSRSTPEPPSSRWRRRAEGDGAPTHSTLPPGHLPPSPLLYRCSVSSTAPGSSVKRLPQRPLASARDGRTDGCSRAAEKK